MKKTERGFSVKNFTDYYGKKCSIQKSSLATKDAIWLGVDNAGPQMGTHANQDVECGRMHLTQSQVKKLMPYLIKFVETGDLR